MMLGYEHTFVSKQRRIIGSEIEEHERIVRVVRWIVKNDIPANWMLSSGKIFSGQGDNFGFRFVYSDQVKILLDQRACTSRFIDKSDELRASRKSLDPDRPGTRAQIQKPRVITDAGSKYVE